MRGASHTHQGLVQGRMSLWLELSRHKDDHHTTDPEQRRPAVRTWMAGTQPLSRTITGSIPQTAWT